MSRRIHGLFVPLVFPTGIAPGGNGADNLLKIARDGRGQPVLRGSALAGALRHAWKRCQSRQFARDELDAVVKRYFGYSLGDKNLNLEELGEESPLQVSDVSLGVGQVGGVVTRTHHLRNRHTGVVADGGLFTLEACPPRTTGTAVFWLRDDDDSPEDAQQFLATLVGLLASGVTLGGKSARGLGAVAIHGSPRHKVYDLRSADGYAEWLDEHRAWRADPSKLPVGTELPVGAAATGDMLTVTLTLGIPRGQDLLIADGQGSKYDAEPQRVVAADGSLLWRLPGSSLRGLLRSWITRLAAREGKPVADSVERQQRFARTEEPTDALNGENLGWCFLPRDLRKSGVARTDCPVAKLFGSLFHAGRIHVSDAYAPCSTNNVDAEMPEEQARTHVAIDRITGGAAESLLFENSVLLSSSAGKPVRFEVTLRVLEPAEDEARWLVKTVRALDLGLLRVGSSKSSGRLSLVERPRASGRHAELFEALQPHFPNSMF